MRSANPLWSILHAPGFVLNSPEHVVFVAYPLIPWIGVTAVGYGLGQIYGWDADRRRALLLRLGLALSVAFLVIRGLNVYGDPSRWMRQKTAAFTALSFLNTTKYPPSLLFLLMTLGPALVFSGLVDRRTPRLLRPALVIGKVPLFYYLLHFSLIHLLAVATCYVRYGSAHWMFESPGPRALSLHARRLAGGIRCRSSTWSGRSSWSRCIRSAGGSRRSSSGEAMRG